MNPNPSNWIIPLSKGGPFALLAAGAMYMVYLLAVGNAQDLSVKVETVRAAVLPLEQQGLDLRNEFQQLRIVVTTEQTKQTKILQTICKNQAKTAAIYQECVDPN